ncbi:hypothetical protein C8R45DRAFT_1013604 [Mycena sanguinolenta]|nr:hypothetical protein C8R45DRAFT_1013604 [Mycena sanguinolenta]
MFSDMTNNTVHPRHLPPPPQTQARNSLSFIPPPLDGSLTITQIYDWHFRNTPNHCLFVYTKKDGSIQTIHWPEAVHAVYVGARILRTQFNWVPGRGKTPVIAILASSDTIVYSTLFMSCLRANYVVFPISPRNSPSAIAHLLNNVGVEYILIGHEPAMLELANAARNILKNDSRHSPCPDISYIPLFEDLFLPAAERTILPEDLLYEYKGPDAPACIIHSSGSTAFPKPIYWSNHRIVESALIPWFGERDLTNQVLALHSMPMYHIMGLLQIWWAASAGLVLSVFEPQSIPAIATPGSLFQAAKATNSDIILCVPALIEAWSREPEDVRWLATRSGLLYGGGPLNREVGDYMTSQGVTILLGYGTTEAGVISLILPAEVGYDWEYFSFPSVITPEMVPNGNNTFELVVVPNIFCTPSVLNTEVRGIESYATSDLLIPHPTKPGYWRIFGRADDQIMHNTGEKTNPGPLENLLNQDPYVRSSAMFGRGRFQAGVIVDPKPPFAFDPADTDKLAEFRNKIWPTIEKMNEFAPQHSRLFKEVCIAVVELPDSLTHVKMILVARPDKPFTYTAKMTVRRKAVIADYEAEIAAVYETVEDTATLNIPALLSWDADSILEFVRNAVRSVVSSELGDDDDMFHHGCDSLQATWIRNALLGALRESAQLDTRENTSNFVYTHPTIRRLGEYVFALASGQGGEDTSAEAKSGAMQAMVQKYTQDIPRAVREQGMPLTGEAVVLVTGTTGELGCYLLARLLASDNIARVFALNRPSRKTSLIERQCRALVDRGPDPAIVHSPKLSLLEGDLTKPDFDLPAAVYEEMQKNVTHIIHSAWQVDFNLALRSFEPNISGLRRLVDFSLGSPFVQPPTLIYTSSIGVFQDVDGAPFSEAKIESAIAAGTGYQQSKWIAEEILLKVGEATSLKPLVVRVGQLCGGINGAWNAQEWVPAIVQSAKILGCIPDDSREVSWLPVPVAAAAIIDFLEVHATGIVHLVNPRPVPWHTLAAVVAAELDGVPRVLYAEWLSRLEQAANGQAASLLRASRLLQFFQSVKPDGHSSNVEAFGLPRVHMRRALGSSRSLADEGHQLGADDVKKWIKYWRSVGLL